MHTRKPASGLCRWSQGFFDELNVRNCKGYASMEYKVTGYRANDLVRLDIKVRFCRHLRIISWTPGVSAAQSRYAPARGPGLILDVVGAQMNAEQDRPAGHHCAPRRRLPRGQGPGQAPEGAHPAPAVQGAIRPPSARVFASDVPLRCADLIT